MASKKSPNFTELEKTVLIELVDSRKGIIESKQNDDSVVSSPGDWIGIYVQSIAPTIPGILLCCIYCICSVFMKARFHV
jgi:hypothetical protein